MLGMGGSGAEIQHLQMSSWRGMKADMKNLLVREGKRIRKRKGGKQRKRKTRC